MPASAPAPVECRSKEDTEAPRLATVRRLATHAADTVCPSFSVLNMTDFLANVPLTTGHLSRDCTQGQKCYNCGMIGHLSRDCPSEQDRVCYK